MSSTLTLSKTRVSPVQRSSAQLMTLEADKAAHKYVSKHDSRRLTMAKSWPFFAIAQRPYAVLSSLVNLPPHLLTLSYFLLQLPSHPRGLLQG